MTPADNPYVGPRSLDEGESIFGRDHELAELRSLLLSQRIALLYSPSGAGKTSLIEAGLRPQLEGRGFNVFPTIRVGHELTTEDSQPIENRYRSSVIASLEERDGIAPDQQLSTQQIMSMPLEEYFARADEHDDQNPVFIFDQFEELFTLDGADYEVKEAFLRELGDALKDRSRWALFSMREDFIAQLDPYLPLIPTGLNSRFRLGLLSIDAAKLAAQMPAAGQGVAFDDHAVAHVVRDLSMVRVHRRGKTDTVEGPSIEPVQLQVVCRRIWTELPAGAKHIGEQGALTSGGVNRALGAYYEDAIHSLKKPGVSEARLRRWFDNDLISDDGFRNTVRTAPGRAGNSILHQLQDAHLIRADRRRGTEWYELTHDRFVQPIQNSNRRARARRSKVLATTLIILALIASVPLALFLTNDALNTPSLAIGGPGEVVELDDLGVARYRFTAAPGDVLTTTLSSQEGSAADVRLLSVSGDELGALFQEGTPIDPSIDAGDATVARLSYQFVNGGGFVIEVMSAPNAALTIDTDVDEDSVVQDLTDGAMGSINQPGDVVTYRLAGSPDDAFAVTLLTGSEELLQGQLRLLNEQGIEVDKSTAEFGNPIVQLQGELETSVTRYVQVSGTLGTTGRFEMSMGDDGDFTPLLVDSTTQGTISSEIPLQQYQFDANAGTTYNLAVAPDVAFDPVLWISGPDVSNGRRDAGFAGELEEHFFTAEISATYRITVGGHQETVGDYEFTLSEVPTTVLTIGSTVSGSIAASDGSVFYLITPPEEGMQLSLLPSATFDGGVTLLEPDGTWTDRDFYEDGQTEVLAFVPRVAGSHLIVVDGWDGSIGDFTLTASPIDAILARVGDPFEGTIVASSDRTAVQRDIYRMQADLGDVIQITVEPEESLDVLVDVTGFGAIYQAADDWAEGEAEVLVFSPIATGPLLISVGGFERSTGDYRLAIEKLKPEEAEFTNEQSGTITEAGAHGVFQFNAFADESFSLSATPADGLDLRVIVTGSLGLIARADQRAKGESEIAVFDTLVDGRYFAVFSGDGDSAGDFDFTIELTD